MRATNVKLKSNQQAFNLLIANRQIFCVNLGPFGRPCASKKYSKLLLDDRAEGVRGKMRYRKACATYPNKMKEIRKRLRGKFPGLRQAKNDWLANRILRNVLHNSMPRTPTSSKSPRKSSPDASASAADEETYKERTGNISEEEIQGKQKWNMRRERTYVEENWLSESNLPR